MSTELTIFNQVADFTEDGRKRLTLVEVTTIDNYEVIEPIQNLGLKSWHVESECGCIFELSGEELNQFIDRLQFEDNSLVGFKFDDNDYYRCTISF